MKRIALAIAVLAGCVLVSCNQPSSSKSEEKQEVKEAKSEMKEPVQELTSVKVFNTYMEKAAAYIDILKETISEEGLASDKVREAIEDAERGLKNSYETAKQDLTKALADKESILKPALDKLEKAHNDFLAQIKALTMVKRK